MAEERDPSVFSRLYRWAAGQQENFTTAAFAWVLDLLLQREPSAARAFISWLCFGDDARASVMEGQLHIRTQGHATLPSGTEEEAPQHRIPDMVITGPEFLGCIEVKTGAQPGGKQLSDYRKILDDAKEERDSSLVLLSIYPKDLEQKEKPDREVLWHEVAERLEQLMGELDDEVARFGLKQFHSFLEEEVMAFARVGWELDSGAKAAVNLFEMLGMALEKAGLSIARRTSGSGSWDYYLGYNLQGNVLWAGVPLRNASEVFLGLNQAMADERAFKELGWGDWNDGKPRSSKLSQTWAGATGTTASRSSRLTLPRRRCISSRGIWIASWNA